MLLLEQNKIHLLIMQLAAYSVSIYVTSISARSDFHENIQLKPKCFSPFFAPLYPFEER